MKASKNRQNFKIEHYCKFCKIIAKLQSSIISINMQWDIVAWKFFGNEFDSELIKILNFFLNKKVERTENETEFRLQEIPVSLQPREPPCC